MADFKTIKGFAFDLDGVITDTARFHAQAWHKTADAVGTPWSETLANGLRGVSRMDSLELILRTGGHEQDYTQAQKEALAQQKNDNYQALIQQLTPADILPGILQFLDELQQAHYLLSIASASKNAPFILDKLGIADRFDGIVDPNTLHQGKPDPEIFIRAAEIIHLPPTQVIGIEDAIAGIAAINAAGEVSVGIGDPQVLSAANINFKDTQALTLKHIQQSVYFQS
ncbi:beta-phosphoglucomutase [Agrilactobacillus fermenti]|uniref:beta-phosphoglucomutase n=1 Tax=Agrilactobacillus fermenti TaxID=2586909 RepID=UPI001E37EACA|nr:beta-phosphoglucomutase [Agrilactobacillus fermenti]MCD2255376.1 beta-phosphoglucomutase [Agrilactobacillus fermenti]